MAESARTQFFLDVPRVDLWLDTCYMGHLSPMELWEKLFTISPSVTAWRMVDAVSQGTLAPWYAAANDTFAYGNEQHLVSHERQRIAIDTVESVVRIEREFRTVQVKDGEDEQWGNPMRLYLEIDCKTKRRPRSTWQFDVKQDGILLLPIYG